MLKVNGQVIAYLHESLTPELATILGSSVGDCNIQQATEAFVLLLALRTWHHQWFYERCFLHVRSDYITALSLLLRLRGAGAGTTRIAR